MLCKERRLSKVVVNTCNTVRKVELIVLSRNIHWWSVLNFSMKISENHTVDFSSVGKN